VMVLSSHRDYRERLLEILYKGKLIEELEDFAYKEYMSDDDVVIVEKSRQVGISYVMSVRMLADALAGKSWVVFSESKEEAERKVGYIRALINGLGELGFDCGLVGKGSDRLKFKNGASIVVMSYRGSRGRGYSGSVFIDECFWIPSSYLEDLVKRTNPVRVRSKGVLRFVGSSSYRSHILYSGRFGADRHEKIYWWDSRYFCKDVARARREALGMATRDRVYKFGNRGLVKLYEDIGSDIDFAREMECYVVDLVDGIVSYDALMGLVDLEIEGGSYIGLIGFSELMEKLVNDGRTFYVGVDVGRRNNNTELVFVSLDKEVLYNLTLSNVSFEDQRLVLKTLIDKGVVNRMVIDASGLGMDLGEELVRYRDDIVSAHIFTREFKEMLVRGFSRLVGSKGIRLAYLRDMINQVLDMRVEVSNAGNVLYKVSSNKHNGDKFWALCLALYSVMDWGFVRPASEYFELPSYMLYGTHMDRRKVLWRAGRIFS